jgi:hypothetical protein
MDPSLRLNLLYKTPAGYSNSTLYGAEAASKFGVTPSQHQYFKSLHLDSARVYESISVLARWKEHRTYPYICAIQISAIWS